MGKEGLAALARRSSGSGRPEIGRLRTALSAGTLLVRGREMSVGGRHMGSGIGLGGVVGRWVGVSGGDGSPSRGRIGEPSILGVKTLSFRLRSGKGRRAHWRGREVWLHEGRKAAGERFVEAAKLLVVCGVHLGLDEQRVADHDEEARLESIHFLGRNAPELGEVRVVVAEVLQTFGGEEDAGDDDAVDIQRGEEDVAKLD